MPTEGREWITAQILAGIIGALLVCGIDQNRSILTLTPLQPHPSQLGIYDKSEGIICKTVFSNHEVLL